MTRIVTPNPNMRVSVRGPGANATAGAPVSGSVAIAQSGAAATARVTVAQVGLQGASGSGALLPGPGFKIVGSEIRYDIQSLTRG